MKRKGFTLVELLVVIAIIALLMGILMPALAKVKQLANQLICGTNLSAIGKAMLAYSADYEETYPIAGKRSEFQGELGYKLSTQRRLADFDNPEREDAFGEQGATITSCLYLVVRYADGTPKQFVCNGDPTASVFELHEISNLHSDVDDVTEVWDFGDGQSAVPGKKCSYAYHNPFRENGGIGYAVSPVSKPESPIASDRNPYMDKRAANYIDGRNEDDQDPEWKTESGTAGYLNDPDNTMNSSCHERQGQNILYNDIHVKFESGPNMGIGQDNIYKSWQNNLNPGDDEPDDEEKQMGDIVTTLYSENQVRVLTSKHEKDAILISGWQGQ